MKLVRVLAVISLLIAMVSSASAFNGLRKGFVLGGGLGVAPMTKWSAESDASKSFLLFFDRETDESGVGVASNFFLGYAWDELNMVVWEANVSVLDSDVWGESVGQGYSGPSWYHYFGPVGKSPLTVVGLGLCYNKFGSADVNDFGLAILIGAGYEFARHVQVVGYFFTGNTKGPALNTYEWSHSHLSVVVSAVAF